MIHDIANENWMLKDNLELGLKHLIKNRLILKNTYKGTNHQDIS